MGEPAAQLFVPHFGDLGDRGTGNSLTGLARVGAWVHKTSHPFFKVGTSSPLAIWLALTPHEPAIFGHNNQEEETFSPLCRRQSLPWCLSSASPTAVKSVAQIKHTARAVCLPHRLCLPRRFRQSCAPSSFCPSAGDALTKKEAFENDARFQVQNVTGFLPFVLEKKRYTPTKLNMTALPLQHRCAESVR